MNIIIKLKNKRKINFIVISLLLTFIIFGMSVYGGSFNNPEFDIKLNKSEDVMVSNNGTGIVNTNDGNDVCVSYNIEPKKITIEKQKVDVVVIVDTSRTNAGNIGLINKALENFAKDFLVDSTKRLGLVEYNGSAKITRELTSGKLGSSIIKNYENNKSNHLGTNTGDALRLAKGMLNKDNNKNKKVIIFMTNGFANAYTGRFFKSNKEYNPQDKKIFWSVNYNNNEFIRLHSNGKKNLKAENIIGGLWKTGYRGEISFEGDTIKYDGNDTLLSKEYFCVDDVKEINNRMWSTENDGNKEKLKDSLKGWNHYLSKKLYLKDVTNIRKNLKNYNELKNPKFTKTQYFNNILGQIYSCYMAKEVGDSGITMYPMFFGDTDEIINNRLKSYKDGEVVNLSNQIIKKVGGKSSNKGILIKSTDTGYSRYGTVYQLSQFSNSTKNILVGENSNDSLNSKFNEALDMIKSESEVKTILDFSKIPNAVSVDKIDIVGSDNAKIKDIGNGKYELTITYKKDTGESFKANKFDIKVTYKAHNNKGDIIKEKVEPKLMNSDNTDNLAKIPEVTFNIGKIGVTININDFRGAFPSSYNSYKKDIDLGNTKEAKEIFGQGLANIKVNGIVDGKKQYSLKYSFVNENNEVVKEGEFNLNSNGNIINTNDIDIGKEGNLNAMFYQNLIPINDKSEKTWTDRNKLFQKAKGKAEILPAIIPQEIEQNTIFLNNSNHEGIRLPNYTAINKYWGYIKPNKTGWYILGADADDGVRGYIKTNDKEIDFTENTWGIDYANFNWEPDKVDKGIVYLTSNFSPHRATYFSSFKPLYLYEDMYYPIYVEYYNYGGSGAFELNYNYYKDTQPEDIVKINNEIKKSIIGVANKDYITRSNFNWAPLKKYDSSLEKFRSEIDFMGKGFKFYPSKNNTPGEIASATFSGQSNLQLPFSKVPYKINYEVVEKSDSSPKSILKGEYGYFQNNEVFNVNLSSNDHIIPGKEITLNYTIEPKKINFNNGDKKIISVHDINITAQLPKGIVLSKNDSKDYSIIKNEDSKFTIEFKNPIYFEKKEPSAYVADKSKIIIPIKVKVNDNIKASGDFIDLDGNILSYKCGDSDDIITQYFKGKLDFAPIIHSEVVNIGLLDYKNINLNNNKISKGIPSKVGIIININSNKDSVILETDNGKINDKTLEIYELDENNNIVGEKKDITANNIKVENGGKVKIALNDVPEADIGKTYVIISEITSDKRFKLTASIENKSKKVHKIFEVLDMPDVF